MNDFKKRKAKEENLSLRALLQTNAPSDLTLTLK